MDKRGTTNNTVFPLAPQHCIELTPKLKRTVDIGRPRIIVQFNRQKNRNVAVSQFFADDRVISTNSHFSKDSRFLALAKSPESA
jgi:hypothetical protein